MHIVVTPLHPTYANILKECGIHDLNDAVVRQIKEKSCSLGYSVHDFSDVASFGGDLAEFYDGSHQTTANLERMVKVLLGRTVTRSVAGVPDDFELLDAVMNRTGPQDGPQD